jgi:hypothetical protein
MDAALKHEFHAALARAGIAVPPDREAAMFQAFLGYRELASLLDAPLPRGVEPAAAYVARAREGRR